MERLRAENAKLRAAETAGASGNGQQEHHSEVAQLRKLWELYEQALQDLQAKQEDIEEVNSQAELLSQKGRIWDLEIEVHTGKL